MLLQSRGGSLSVATKPGTFELCTVSNKSLVISGQGNTGEASLTMSMEMKGVDATVVVTLSLELMLFCVAGEEKLLLKKTEIFLYVQRNNSIFCSFIFQAHTNLLGDALFFL